MAGAFAGASSSNHMTPEMIALFRELADRSPEERAQFYAWRGVPADVSAALESLLRFDRETVDEPHDRVAAAALLLLDPPILTNGTVFGPYRIVTPLGRGGMGVVYAAEEMDSGRRVALKVLGTVRQNMHERERFEREGRLAASLNHPHCVFVFGASEIDGHPAIAMEMMQETLADRLKRDGPLPPAAAVDAMLQIVAGLQAAAAAGILHRDVKPSNCFVDSHGVVKIGDFGISRSERPTEQTELSTDGRCPATPAYAPPEQLRGAALDVRADIYSVCATLYELLTGRRPFDAPDLMALLMAIANDTPSAPHALVPAVPKGLSTVVLHGLAKRPEERFADYDALAAALEPYASNAPTAATVGRRCLAGAIDGIPQVLFSVPIGMWWALEWYTMPPLLTACAVEILYFAICESLWAATPGKAICGLMVVQQEGTPAGVWHVIVRATTYVMGPALPVLVLVLVSATLVEAQLFVVAIGRLRFPIESVGRLTASADSLHIVISAASTLTLLLLFAPARRHNAYAAIHDRISRTRIVERRVRARRLTSPPVPAQAPSEAVRHLGPFAVLPGGVPGLPEAWRSAVDGRLRRPVWIREVPPGTPPIPSARRSINRATRLRWLAGRRNEDEAWDVFEAVQGMPLDRAVVQPRGWQDARVWLADLARECRAHSVFDQPPRSLDRVWILDSGGATLIDDPAIDRADESANGNPPVAEFLLDIVHAARESAHPQTQTAPRRTATPWPLRAHQFLDTLEAEPNLDAESIVNTMKSLMQDRPAVTPGWRLFTVVIPLLLPLLWASTSLIFVPPAMVMTQPVPATAGSPPSFAWDVPLALGLIGGLFGLFFVAATALVDAIAWRGGVMRVLGLEIVTGDGRPASRSRVFLRTLLTWSPVLPALVVIWGLPSGELSGFSHATSALANAIGSAFYSSGATGLILRLAPMSLLVLLAGGIVAIVNPSRGIQDRLAGTWIVPR